MLAFVDHSVELRQIAQRANRANVTFYIVDPRGLAPFDDTIGPMRPASPGEDRSRMSARQGAIRELAFNTDGAAVLNSSDVRGGLARMMADASSYYLMQYYSTNAKLDGRFRRISVRVKRPGIQVRARPGYLAPSEAEAAAAGVPVQPPAMPPGIERIARRPEIIALRRGPSTGLSYVRGRRAAVSTHRAAAHRSADVRAGDRSGRPRLDGAIADDAVDRELLDAGDERPVVRDRRGGAGAVGRRPVPVGAVVRGHGSARIGQLRVQDHSLAAPPAAFASCGVPGGARIHPS